MTWQVLRNGDCYVAFDYEWWLNNLGMRHDDAELAETGNVEWDGS